MRALLALLGALAAMPASALTYVSTGSAGLTIRDDGGSTARRAADGAVDRIINLFR